MPKDEDFELLKIQVSYSHLLTLVLVLGSMEFY